MQYLDHRLSKILSDIRIEQARQHNQRRQDEALRRLPIRQRLGRWLIDRGENLIDSEPRAA